MKDWLIRAALLATFLCVIGLPILWRPAEATPPPGAARLIVITPHNELLQYEVEIAFSRWHEKNYGQAVIVDWRRIGGSSDVLRQLRAEYEAFARQGREDQAESYDVVFGGGDYLFIQLKKGVKVDGPDGKPRTVSITQPATLPEGLVREVFPEAELAGKPLYDVDLHWFGVALSSFGILFNRDVLRDRDLDEPRTWSDLTDPRFLGWVGLADAAHSGTLKATYEAIIQRYGWERGWPVLRRICANARYFAADSNQVPLDVSSGEVAAGLSVDFYARFQASAVGGERLEYVAPAGATVVNADPVAVLRGAPHVELANRFVEFLLSFEGQCLWSFRVGDPLGPVKFAQRRPPVRRELYESPYLERMIDQVNLYEIATPLPPGTPSYFDVMPTVMNAMAIDVHDELREAWQAVSAEADPGRREEMLKLFDELPFTLDELKAAPKRWKERPEAQTEDRLRWTEFFREQYRRTTE